MSPSSYGRQVVGPSSLLVVVAQGDKRIANRALVLAQFVYCFLENAQQERSSEKDGHIV